MTLCSRLQHDDKLRGNVYTVAAEAAPGGPSELLTVALGSGGAVAALGGVLSAWLLSSRRAKVIIEMTDGHRTRQVEIDSANAGTATRLLREAYEVTGSQP